jgi:hypothetical protein
MSHSVEDLYLRAQALHKKALMLHRERYKVKGAYDKIACQALLDDIKYLAKGIERGHIDLDIDFGKNSNSK